MMGVARTMGVGHGRWAWLGGWAWLRRMGVAQGNGRGGRVMPVWWRWGTSPVWGLFPADQRTVVRASPPPALGGSGHSGLLRKCPSQPGRRRCCLHGLAALVTSPALVSTGLHQGRLTAGGGRYGPQCGGQLGTGGQSVFLGWWGAKRITFTCFAFTLCCLSFKFLNVLFSYN